VLIISFASSGRIWFTAPESNRLIALFNSQKQKMSIIAHGAVSGPSPAGKCLLMNTIMNTHDIYVQYEASEPLKGRAPKVLRAYVKVPRTKIEEYRRQANDYASDDNDIAQTLSDSLAFNLLGQLRGYWISCLDTLPVDVQERAPAFKEKDGMAFWLIRD